MMKSLLSFVLLVSFAVSAQAAPAKKISAKKAPIKLAQAEEVDPVDAEVSAANAEQARGSSMITNPYMKSRADYLQKGFALGAFYQQLGTQISIKFEGPGPFGRTTYKSNGRSSTDLKFAGLTLRYGEAPLQGIGYHGSVSWGKLTNQKDLAPLVKDVDDTTIVRGELNVVMSKQTGRESALYALAGGSLHQFFGNGAETDFYPGMGIQGGGGYAFTRNITLDAVYFFTSQQFTDRWVKRQEGDSGQIKVDRTLSGIVTQGALVRTTYTF